MGLTKYTIGELIELVEETNAENKYGPDDVRGMTITKEIIPTKADVANTDLSRFWVVHPKEFIYNPRTHGKHIGFGYNDTQETFIISWNNIAFRVKDCMKSSVLPEYLFMHFNRKEWDREACYRSWGSSTEVFSWDALCEMTLNLPPLEIQQKYVDIYYSLLENQRSYERGVDDLKLVCNGYIENLRKRMPKIKIGPYIREVTERNSDATISIIQGVSSDGLFCETRANTTDLDISNYKIVRKNQIAYNPSRINLGSVALKEDDTCIVSPMYIVVSVTKKSILLPKYLMLWFGRKEFQRSTLYFASGSVRDIFDYNLLCNVEIPIPEIKIQQSIVDIYDVYQARRKINESLKIKTKTICSLLIKGSLEEGKAN